MVIGISTFHTHSTCAPIKKIIKRAVYKDWQIYTYMYLCIVSASVSDDF